MNKNKLTTDSAVSDKKKKEEEKFWRFFATHISKKVTNFGRLSKNSGGGGGSGDNFDK